MVLAYGLGFGWLAAQRHQTYRTNAEDLGFTDQAIWNFLRGQFMRFSIYDDAEFQTDIDLKALRRPDSFLAFHVEPILILFVPLYVVPGLDVRALLWSQTVLVALGALPAYSLGSRRLGGRAAGLAAAASYLLSPLGQWAVLADFHTVALAAPLLMWAIDSLDRGRGLAFLAAAFLAAMTKEEIGLVVAGLGLLAAVRPGMRRVGMVAVAGGVGWSLLCVGLIIPSYAGAEISPFAARYAHLGGRPAEAVLTLFRDPAVFVQALTRPEVLGYAGVLLAAGGWLGLAAPHWLAPAGVVLALNVLSSSPWMASGRAHYSASVLPILVAAAVFGVAAARQRFSRLATLLPAMLALGGGLAYAAAGAGPGSDGFRIPPSEARHAALDRAVSLIPPGTRVSASSSVEPHLSRRPNVRLFPTVGDAEYVVVDAVGTSFPTSVSHIYGRTQDLLESGEWRVLFAEHGALVLANEAAPPGALPDAFFAAFRRDAPNAAPVSHLGGALDLLVAELVPSGETGPRGPLATLQTTWRANREIQQDLVVVPSVQFSDGTVQRFDDLAAMSWYPPRRWRLGETVAVDVPGLPLRWVTGWEMEVVAE